jgi:hypothetical protein
MLKKKEAAAEIFGVEKRNCTINYLPPLLIYYLLPLRSTNSSHGRIGEIFIAKFHGCFI